MRRNYELAKFFGLAFALVFIGYYVLAQSTGTGTGGSANNVVSSGGSGTIITNTANNWSGIQTFTSPVIMNGATNVFGNSAGGSTNILYGPLMLNTNAINSAYMANFVNNSTRQSWAFSEGSGSTFTELDIGDPFNVNGNAAARYGSLQYNNSSLDFQIYNIVNLGKLTLGAEGTGQMIFTKSGIPNTIAFYPNGSLEMVEFNGNGAVIGGNASSTLSIPGTTVTGANGLNINSGTLVIPSAFTGTTTNQGNFTSLNTVTASNIVAQTTDGTSYFNSGTNQTARIIINSAAGILQTEALMTTRTNTLTKALPIHNDIYTNNNMRLNLNVNMLTAIGTGVAVWTVSGGTTNYFDRKIMNAVTTNSVTGWIQPNALYGVTNFQGTAPTLIPGEWNETRF